MSLRRIGLPRSRPSPLETVRFLRVGMAVRVIVRGGIVTLLWWWTVIPLHIVLFHTLLRGVPRPRIETEKDVGWSHPVPRNVRKGSLSSRIVDPEEPVRIVI